MTKAIRIHETGGTEVMRWEDDDPGQPATGEALVRHEAVGLKFYRCLSPHRPLSLTLSAGHFREWKAPAS